MTQVLLQFWTAVLILREKYRNIVLESLFDAEVTK